MADQNPQTPGSTKGATASSFETAASTPSSRVDSPSPVGLSKRVTRSVKLSLTEESKNKNKNMNKGKKTDVEKPSESDEVTMRDILEAGPSKSRESAMSTGSLSDCEIVESATAAVPSESSASYKSKRGKRKRIIESDESITDSDIKETIKENTMDALTSLSAGTLASRAFESLTTIDELRARSRNIQGSVSGNMKRNLMQVKRAVTILLARVHATGDPKHLKKKIEDQAFEILSLKAKLQDSTRNEQYYREQAGEGGVSVRNVSKRLDKPVRKAALRSRMTNQGDVGKDMETEVSSDEGFSRPLAVPQDRETTDDPSQDLDSQRPAGMSPERWRRTNRRGRSIEASQDIGGDLAGIKLFIRQQIGQAIEEIKSNKSNRNEREIENSRIKNKSKILKKRSVKCLNFNFSKEIEPNRSDVDIGDNDNNERSAVKQSGRSSVSWAEVTARTSPRDTRRKIARKENAPSRRTGSPAVKVPPKVKIPRLAAVSILCKNKEDYPKILSEAKERIDLSDIGISETTVSHSFAGALMVLIPREEEKEKAPLLAARIAELVAGRDDVRVSVPSKKADVKLTQIDCSTTEGHIRDALVAYGGCLPTDVRVGEIRFSQRGNGSTIIQCPAMMANDLVAAGKLKLGWSVIKVELMPGRVNKCYKCWETGHFQANCTNSIDRAFNCFNCGEKGHKAKDCVEKACCPVCQGKSLPCDHQCGRSGCSLLAQPNSSVGKVVLGQIPGRRPEVQSRTSLRAKNAGKL